MTFSHLNICFAAWLALILPWQTVSGEEIGPIAFDPAFTVNSSSESDQPLVVMLITDDDPFRTILPFKDQDEQAVGVDADARFPWCIRSFSDALRSVRHARDDFAEHIKPQVLPAGLPRELIGGQDDSTPRKTIVVVCDHRYRLLALTVGVPNGEQLLTLVEDAEEVMRYRNQFAERPQAFYQALADRGAERVSRVWKIQIQSNKDVLSDTALDASEQPDNQANVQLVSIAKRRNEIYQACETFEPTYLADAKLRFGLSAEPNRRRLLILEHHTQTRRPWCESVFPMLALLDIEKNLSPLLESIWGHPPILGDLPGVNSEDDRLVTWLESQRGANSVVFSLRSPAAIRYLPWPPSEVGASRGARGWSEVHQSALKGAFRQVDLQTLAGVIRKLDVPPIDVRGGVVRYILIPPKQDRAHVVRASEAPGRFANLLKKYQTNLVVNQ